MRQFHRVVAPLFIVSVACVSFAADAPPASSDVKNVRLIKPFSELKDLTSDQTDKLKLIHKKYLDEIKALENKQREELMSVLSEAQKREIAEIESGAKTAKKTTAKKPAPAGNAPANPNGASRDPEAK